nr:hypothetical protein [Tanacetum cinerariifolium]
DSERPDKRQRSGDRHQQTSQQSSHRSHGQNNDRHGSDRRGGNDNYRGSNNSNNYSSSDNMNSGNGRDQRNRGHQSNRSTNSGSQQSRGPSEGYSYPFCTTFGRRHQGECRRAAGTCFKCGQAGHLQKDCRKNTTTSTTGQADKKPGSDEIKPTNDETSGLEETDHDDEQEIGEIFRIETNLFDYETPLCEKFKEFNYLLKIDSNLLTKDIKGFKTYKEFKDD